MTSLPSSQNKGRIPILLSVCLAGIICPMSFSGGAVATPAIGRELGGDPIALNWITNAFMLTFGGFQMVAGENTGNKKGHGMVWSTGIKTGQSC